VDEGKGGMGLARVAIMRAWLKAYICDGMSIVQRLSQGVEFIMKSRVTPRESNQCSLKLSITYKKNRHLGSERTKEPFRTPPMHAS
jgi:hypothetical protein